MKRQVAAPTAKISHQIPNRVRIRIPEKRNKSKYFSLLERELSKLPGVESVRVRPSTASALIRFNCPIETLIEYARTHGLFDLQKSVPSDPWAEKILMRLEAWDEQLSTATNGQWDLFSAAAAGLVGISIYQMTQRQFFPPAWSLLGDAADLLIHSRHSRAKRSGGAKRASKPRRAA